jgi:hypothetical protein
MVLMAVADPNYRSVYVDIGRCGKKCDFIIFNPYPANVENTVNS